jgi:hypothetical protein
MAIPHQKTIKNQMLNIDSIPLDGHSPFSEAISNGSVWPIFRTTMEVQQWSMALQLLNEMRQKFVPPNVARFFLLSTAWAIKLVSRTWQNRRYYWLVVWNIFYDSIYWE